MTGALSQFKILDLSRVLAGPFCTMILGDLGAEVIKVEAPGGSDDTRKWGPPFQNGVSAYYICANRNKKSITIDLKTAEGIQNIKELIKTCDVVIHNFKTGTMERYGLDYETLASLNPKIVYCSITGFGETGPYKDLPGYDFIIQAMSGFMSITGDKHSGPQKVGVAITDILTGLYACIGIQAALHERTQSGKGQKLDISLYESAVSALVNIASNYLMSGKIPGLLGNRHANIVPYQTFRTMDGEIVVAVGNDQQFQSFCALLNLKHIARNDLFKTNANRVQNQNQLVNILQEKLIKDTTANWLKKCREHQIPAGPIQTIEQVVQDPQLISRGMFVEMDLPKAGSIRMVGSPLKLSRTPVIVRHHPPEPGEHNGEIIK